MKKLLLIFVSLISMSPTIVFSMMQFPVITPTVDQIVSLFAPHEQLTLEEQHDLRQKLAPLAFAGGRVSIFNEDFFLAVAPFARKKDNPLLKHVLYSYIVSGYDVLATQLISDFNLDIDGLLEMNERSPAKTTALCLAVASSGEGPVKIVEYLLQKGANTETPDIAGRTPLGCAASMVLFPKRGENIKKKISLLLNYGASLDSVDQQGHSFLQALDKALDYRRRQVEHLKDNEHAMYHWEQAERQAQRNIDDVRAMPEIAERIAAANLAPFFTGVPGVVGHVLGYVHDHVAKQQNEREDAKNNRDIDRDWPQLSETVDTLLPAWELEASDPAYGLTRLDPVTLVGEYVCEENKSDDGE